jgi:hypothetical protein
VVHKILEWIFGTLGCISYYVGWFLLEAVLYVPRKLGEVAQASGRLFLKLWSELMVYLNPKRL